MGKLGSNRGRGVFPGFGGAAVGSPGTLARPSYGGASGRQRIVSAFNVGLVGEMVRQAPRRKTRWGGLAGHGGLDIAGRAGFGLGDFFDQSGCKRAARLAELADMAGVSADNRVGVLSD